MARCPDGEGLKLSGSCLIPCTDDLERSYAEEQAGAVPALSQCKHDTISLIKELLSTSLSTLRVVTTAWP